MDGQVLGKKLRAGFTTTNDLSTVQLKNTVAECVPSVAFTLTL